MWEFDSSDQTGIENIGTILQTGRQKASWPFPMDPNYSGFI